MTMEDVLIQTEEKKALADDREGGSELIVFNDDVHTFAYVIDCLQTICKLTKEQAVTCTNIIHYKGLCIVKHGSYDVLKQMCIELGKKGLCCEVR